MEFYVDSLEICDIRIAKGEARSGKACPGHRKWLSGEERVEKGIDEKNENFRKITNSSQISSKKNLRARNRCILHEMISLRRIYGSNYPEH